MKGYNFHDHGEELNTFVIYIGKILYRSKSRPTNSSNKNLCFGVYMFPLFFLCLLIIFSLSINYYIWRTAGRCCRNSVSARSRPWKLTSSMHPRAIQKTCTIRNRYSYTYAKICILPTVSLSNGRHLTGLRDLRPWYGKRGYTLGGSGVRLVGPWRVDAVARRRCAGRPAAARKAIGVAEVLRLRSDELFSTKKEI